MELHGTPWNSINIPWNSMEFHGHSKEFHGTSMEFHGPPWNSIEFYGILWNSMEFHGIPWGYFTRVCMHFAASEIGQMTCSTVSYVNEGPSI